MKTTKDERKVSDIIRIRNMIQENIREGGRKEKMRLKAQNLEDKKIRKEKLRLEKRMRIKGENEYEKKKENYETRE